MHINNPTREQLDSWYKCKKNIAHFLIFKQHIPFVHRKDDIFYFVKTEEFLLAQKEIPLWLKIVETIL